MVKASSLMAMSACLIGAALWASGCGSTTTATAPTPTSALTAPSANSPADGAQLSLLRVTLVANNGSSSGSSSPRTYEFQISDRSDFGTTAASTSFAVTARGTGVAEGTGGTTSYTPDFDLQPTTRFYWRVRVAQGGAASDWSASRSFNSAIAGYSRAGELYDPLVNGATVGVAVGATSYVAGHGIRLGDQNSYVRYQLVSPLASGEISMEVEGLKPNGAGQKSKVFSMEDGPGDLVQSNYLLNAQYRGIGGNPDNCIAWKALFGDSFLKIEPDAGVRTAAIIALDPAHAYYWKGTWSNGFTLLVQSSIGGTTLYNYGQTVQAAVGIGAIYNPSPHFAFLGANTGPLNIEEGSIPGTIYRNVWISSKPRPASLGSALVAR